MIGTESLGQSSMVTHEEERGVITHSAATVEKADTSAATTEGDSVNNKCEILCVRD